MGQWGASCLLPLARMGSSGRQGSLPLHIPQLCMSSSLKKPRAGAGPALWDTVSAKPDDRVSGACKETWRQITSILEGIFSSRSFGHFGDGRSFGAR